MTQAIQLSLPLSATALRLGSTFLADLAEQAEMILIEARGPIPFAFCSTEADVEARESVSAVKTNFESVGIPEVQPTETPEERQFRLHGNVASAGMEPVAPPPQQFETVVVGVERNPDYAGDLAAYEHQALTDAGWTDEALLAQEYLREVTEQRPLPVAPSASAPPPAPAPAAPAPNGVQLDADGLPWDARIHSDAAVKLSAKGQWKTRKNLPDGYKAQIEAELRAVMAAGKPTTGTTTAAAVAPPAPSAPVAPAPAPAPGVTPAAPAPSPAGGMTFPEFTRWILGHKLSPTDVVLEVQRAGLTQIPDLAKRPDLIQTVVDALKASKGLQ